MKIKPLLFTALLLSLLTGTGFFCPPVEEYTQDRIPPFPPIIDSVRTGMDSSGNIGVWIYFRPDAADSAEDIESFTLYKNTAGSADDSVEADTAFVKLVSGIPRDVRKYFDSDLLFPDTERKKMLRYKITAGDTVTPSNVSLLSNAKPETVWVCRQAHLEYPANDTTLDSLGDFRFSVEGLTAGYKLFIGISMGDSVYWNAPVCLDQSCNHRTVYASSEFSTKDFTVPYNQNGSGVPLDRGRYLWWISLKWDGSGCGAESLVKGEFVLNE